MSVVPIGNTPAVNPQAPGVPQTLFQRAVEDYLRSLPEKKSKGELVAQWKQSAATPETINEMLQQAASEKGRATTAFTRIFRRIFSELKEYTGVIDQLVTANPMPCALIWGALKVAIESAHRHFQLFDTIKEELRALTNQIQRMNAYDELYGDSEIMQKLLCKSYENMLRFWSRVNKECGRCSFNNKLRSLGSASTKKLNEVIADLEENANDIREAALLIEAKTGKGEREQAEIERQANRKSRDAQEVDRRDAKYKSVVGWLTSRGQCSNKINYELKQKNTTNRFSGTCEWLLQHPDYKTWRDGTSRSPIIWMQAPPGFGKSMLCSFAIHSIQPTPDSATSGDMAAFHFVRFDQSCDATDILCLLAEQLFQSYWRRTQQIDPYIHAFTQTSNCSVDNIIELLCAIVEKVTRVFIFIDGLDEQENRWAEIKLVIHRLTALAVKYPDRLRIWYSSQPRAYISNELIPLGCQVVTLREEFSRDVESYISSIPKLAGNGQRDQVVERAGGNFLWAKLMVDSIEKYANTPRELEHFLRDELPIGLDEYYWRIFDRIPKPQRALAAKIFSLVLFARRPLRIEEIREAIWLLQSKSPSKPSTDDKPFPGRLTEMFFPLIQTDEENAAYVDRRCRIMHSSVRDFLLRHPDVISPDLLISPRDMAEACMLYLKQTRYSQILRKEQNRWYDMTGEPVDQHQFISYAAKYWHRHVEQLPGMKKWWEEVSKEWLEGVDKFLTSTNFQTCLQIQCIWVDGRFNVFCAPTLSTNLSHFLISALPKWFLKSSPDAWKKWRDYQRFTHQWRKLLSCASCGSPKCEVIPTCGEIDRCWWTSLGPDNFLSKIPGRYVSFTLPTDTGRKGASFECPNPDGTRLNMIRLESNDDDTYTFSCEQWHLVGGESPRLSWEGRITVQDTPTTWQYYSPTRQPSAASARPPIAAFSQDGQSLRIGGHIFAVANDGQTRLTRIQPSHGLATPRVYVEEFATRGEIIVLTSRRRPRTDKAHENGLGDNMISGIGEDFVQLELRTTGSIRRTRKVHTARVDTVDEESTSDSSDDAYETYSENSTVLSEDEVFEDDDILPAGRPDIMEESSSDSDGSELNDDVPDSVDDVSVISSPYSSSASSSNSNSDFDSDAPSSSEGSWEWESDDDYPFDQSDSEAEPIFARVRTTRLAARASLHVYNVSLPDAEQQLLRLTLPFHFMIYASPPVVHPASPLVVWPIGGGEILFADFSEKTYFRRRIRPSTLHTKHVSVQCHFSPTGKYLHIAAFEAQRKPEDNWRSSTEKPPLQLAVLVTTYRLSERKTTRAPPSLIHRVKVNLGLYQSLTVSSLPFTLTWTPDRVFLTTRKILLRVYQICLFPNEAKHEDAIWAARDAVLVPKKSIFLPDTVVGREVYFFPSLHSGSTRARILIGSETRPSLPYDLRQQLSPPVGCYIDEDKDIGRWVHSRDRTEIRDDLGIGKLNILRERFDEEDDCD
ncbi:hypothetical protein PQX77_000239, partial [Marasmius sp. AFHP31]